MVKLGRLVHKIGFVKTEVPMTNFGPKKTFLISNGPPSMPALFGILAKVGCACSLLCILLLKLRCSRDSTLKRTKIHRHKVSNLSVLKKILSSDVTLLKAVNLKTAVLDEKNRFFNGY